MRSAFSQAWASWRSAPGIALLAVIAFAVGIGSTTAIFTVINGVLLRPLPYPEGDRFVTLYRTRSTEPDTRFFLSVPELHDYEQQTTSFDAFGWFRGDRLLLRASGEPQFVSGVSVTAGLVRQLGQPLLGQWFADDTSAVLSNALWRRLGGRREIIGTAITLDNRPYTVSGVMPPEFRLPAATLGTGGALGTGGGTTDVWIPLDPSVDRENRGRGAYSAYARLKPGVSVEQARADARRVAAAITAIDPARYASTTAHVESLRETTAPVLRSTLLILLGGATLLLLIACANVATLLLARAVVRSRETAIRVALGASRRQLALRYFAEGALVSIPGAVAGVVLTALFVQQILAVATAYVTRPDLIAIEWPVLGFSVAVAVATGLLAGLAPLWQASRTAPNAVLTEGVRASAAAPARRLSKAFVVAQIALAFTLLSVSAILVVHLRNLGRAPIGYDVDDLVTFDLALPLSVLPQSSVDAALPPGAERNRAITAARRREQERLITALRQTPGVTAAAFASQGSTLCGGGTAVYPDGRATDAFGQRVCLVRTEPEYLSTVRIPLRAGRWLNASDDQPGSLNVVVNEAAARAYWPGEDPVGASGRLSQPDGDLFTIVGVVADIRNTGLNRPPFPELYMPASVFAVDPMSVLVRSALPADQLAGAVRRAIRQANPDLPMGEVRRMDAVVGDTLQLERLSSIVMTFFGLAALLMATLGIYGVVSYFVRQRITELGTRMALGASHRDLVSLVLGGGLKLSLAGVAVGSIALAGGVWLLVRVLDVANVAWLPVGASAAVIAFVATAAASVPAWRTTSLSPMVAIREQPLSVWRWASERIQQTVQDIREAVAGEEEPDVSPTEVLTAFVDAARSADSYTGALDAVLASMRAQLAIDSAALLARRHDSPSFWCVVASGALEAASPEIAADGFLISRLKAYPWPLPFAPSELTALGTWADEHRPDRLGEIRALAAADVRMAVPLRTRSEILGVLLLGDRPRRPTFSTHEKQVLRVCADQFALMLENSRLTDRVVEQETLRRDIALASDIQRRLLPDAPPQREFAEFAAISVPARRIGGDYYDFVELRDRELGIALADVSGKGVAAALIMSVVQASLRIISADSGVSLPRLVARMNQVVYGSTPASKYATFFYAQLDEQRRQLRYVNAGHNAPFLFRASADPSADGSPPRIEQLTVGGAIIGMFPEMEYEEATVELHSGDVLLAFTDGVPEAHSPGNEEFGEERLQDLLVQITHLPADEISARISAEMRQWIRDAEQYDDLTFIVMKVR